MLTRPLAAAACALLSLAFLAPASSATTDSGDEVTRFLDPADGSSFHRPATEDPIRVRVRLVAEPAGQYVVRLREPYGEVDDQLVDHAGGTSTYVAWFEDGAAWIDSYRLDLIDPEDRQVRATSRYQVTEAPVPRFREFSATPRVFHPGAARPAERQARVVLRTTNAVKLRVIIYRAGESTASDFLTKWARQRVMRFRWDGRDRRGVLQPAGAYEVTASARNRWGGTHSETIRVRLRRG